MKRFLLLIVSILAPLFAADCVYASESPVAIATVVAVRGEVKAINPQGVARVLAIKDPLFVEDILRTGKQGRVQLLFRDASIISLASSTEMKLAEYQWDPDTKTGKMKTKVEEGTFRVMGGALTQFAPQNFTTETPTATIGIRGSMYAGTVRGDFLSVVFQGGKGIDIINAAGKVAITTPGFGSQVRGFGKPPSEPQKLSGKDLSIFTEAMTSKQQTDDETGTSDEKQTPGVKRQKVAGSTSQPKKQPEGAQLGAEFVDAGSFVAADQEVAMSGPSFSLLGETIAPLLSPSPVPTVSQYYDPTTNPANLPPEIKELTSPPAKPTDGIANYQGSFNGTSSSAVGSIGGDLKMKVNWHSGKAIGVMNDQSSPRGGSAFFFGTVNDSSLSDVRIFGSDAGDPTSPADRVTSLSGTGTGGFYGTNFDSFNASASGKEYSLAIPQTPLNSTWDLTATAARSQQDPQTLTSPTGSSFWSGFAVGVSENVNGPDVERKLFMNNMPDSPAEQFTLQIDRDQGTIAGRLKAPQLNRMSTTTFGGLDLEIGGAYGSAYVLDGAMAALIGCSGNCINDDSTPTPGFNVGLTPYGNYLITEAPDRQFSSYVTWGYWEISHQEPDGTDLDTIDDMYHTHVPYSTWIAGQKTPASFVDTLLNKTTFVGQYAGMAHGQMIDSMNHAFPLTNGRSNLAIDFGQANVATAVKVKGALTFNEVTLNIDSPVSMLDRQGFKAQIVNPGVIDSAVNGAFYGPNVNAIGGNFQAEFSTQRYLGIFGGNLQNGPAH